MVEEHWPTGGSALHNIKRARFLTSNINHYFARQQINENSKILIFLMS